MVNSTSPKCYSATMIMHNNTGMIFTEISSSSSNIWSRTTILAERYSRDHSHFRNSNTRADSKTQGPCSWQGSSQRIKHGSTASFPLREWLYHLFSACLHGRNHSRVPHCVPRAQFLTQQAYKDGGWLAGWLGGRVDRREGEREGGRETGNTVFCSTHDIQILPNIVTVQRSFTFIKIVHFYYKSNTYLLLYRTILLLTKETKLMSFIYGWE